LSGYNRAFHNFGCADCNITEGVKAMPLSPDQVNEALEYLRTLLAKKKERLPKSGGELDYTAKRDAVLAVKERYPDLSDDQLHDVMQRADE
jgi:hypothetical protein